MAEGCLLYGVGLTAKDFLKIVDLNREKKILIRYDTSTGNDKTEETDQYIKITIRYNGKRRSDEKDIKYDIDINDLESDYADFGDSGHDVRELLEAYINNKKERENLEKLRIDGDRLFSVLSDMLNKRIAPNCKFMLNHVCCDINIDKPVFLGWISERGANFKKINMISTEQKKNVEEIISKYTSKKSGYYVPHTRTHSEYCSLIVNN